MRRLIRSLKARVRRFKRNDRGAALIIAMLITSIMSVATMESLDSMRFAARMTVNMEAREQTKLYALGAEAFASSMLQQAVGPDQNADTVLRNMMQQPIRFPIDGGLIELNLSDGGNCFNMNSLVVSREGEGYVANADEVARFVDVLEDIGVPTPDANDVTNAIVDWLDTDNRPAFGGAEDSYYTSQDLAYRTADQLFIDPTEMRAILGVSRDLLYALDGLICIREDTSPNVLNINTLTFEEAPLLQAYLGEEFDLQMAQSLVVDRPVEGFATLDDFFAQSVFSTRPPTNELKSRLTVSTRYLDLDARIWRDETALSAHFTLQISESGEINTVSRKFGVF